MSVEYPTDIHTADGWGIIARGHGLTAEQQLEIVKEHSPSMLPAEGEFILALEEHFGFAPRVKWCERYGAACDQAGQWHGHWYSLKPNEDQTTKFTLLHIRKGTPMADVQTWDTENQDPVAWGTHDAALAQRAYRKQHVLDGEAMPVFVDGRKLWGHPDLSELESWSKDSVSADPVEGWVPFLVGSW